MANHRIVFMHFIPGIPTPWIRQGAHGKFRWTQSKRQKQAKNALAWEIKAAEPKLRCDPCARFGYKAEFHLFTRADGDNLEKLLMDALEGIVWQNDEQVDEGSWSKKVVNREAGMKLLIYQIET